MKTQNKVLFAFGSYGTNQHPVIWIKVMGSFHNTFMNHSINLLEIEINKYINAGFEIEWVSFTEFQNIKPQPNK